MVVLFPVNRYPLPIDLGFQTVVADELGYDLEISAMMMQIDQILIHIIIEYEMDFADLYLTCQLSSSEAGAAAEGSKASDNQRCGSP